MRARGPRTKAWEKARRELKRRFERAEITRCEFRFDGCWRDNGLSFAHAKKRRELTLSQLYIVGLACAPCHDKLERMPRALMEIAVMKVIDARAVQP